MSTTDDVIKRTDFRGRGRVKFDPPLERTVSLESADLRCQHGGQSRFGDSAQNWTQRETSGKSPALGPDLDRPPMPPILSESAIPKMDSPKVVGPVPAILPRDFGERGQIPPLLVRGFKSTIHQIDDSLPPDFRGKGGQILPPFGVYHLVRAVRWIAVPFYPPLSVNSGRGSRAGVS